MTDPEEVLDFWLDEVGEDGWYAAGEALDRTCRDRFGKTWAAARGGAYRSWLSRPRGALAYLILTDQLPRNIHRGRPEAFATDGLARSAAGYAVQRGHDLRVEGLARQFFYLPFEHAENRQAQCRSVRLFLTRMGDDAGGNFVHAQAHREIIRRFGRFPFRNEVLGRSSTEAEAAFIAEGGYGAVVTAFGG
jgi:uncharacterized protein (DUF924 family)